jgi:energy-coupling factor transporter ATP-binding protein EcfA2
MVPTPSAVEARLIAVLTNLPAHHTIVFTTHRPNWLKLASRVLLLENGEIKLDQPAEKVRIGTANRPDPHAIDRSGDEIERICPTDGQCDTIFRLFAYFSQGRDGLWQRILLAGKTIDETATPQLASRFHPSINSQQIAPRR